MTELEFGVFNSSKPAQNLLALIMFLSNFVILSFDPAAAFEYGDILHYLKSRCIIIGRNDMLIAAHARSLGIALFTRNTREFNCIQNLFLEDWAI